MDQMWTVREEESRMIPRFVWPGQQERWRDQLPRWEKLQEQEYMDSLAWDMMNIQEGYKLGGKLLDMEF